MTWFRPDFPAFPPRRDDVLSLIDLWQSADPQLLRAAVRAAFVLARAPGHPPSAQPRLLPVTDLLADPSGETCVARHGHTLHLPSFLTSSLLAPPLP